MVPFVRIPPNSRETAGNQWIIKQTLDAGVFGLVLPHLNTVEEARAAVVAARYPQVPGVRDFEPEGQRGWWQRLAPRYWGLNPQEYYDAADVWPLDPDGESLLMGIVEEPEGVKNLRDILREVKGIGAIWAGPGDMSVAMGKRGDGGPRGPGGAAAGAGGLPGARRPLRDRRHRRRRRAAYRSGIPHHHSAPKACGRHPGHRQDGRRAVNVLRVGGCDG